MQICINPLVFLQELQRIMSRSLDILYAGTTSASGIQTDLDYYLVIQTIETQIEGWAVEWSKMDINTGQ
jgi:hypothetical protein